MPFLLDRIVDTTNEVQHHAVALTDRHDISRRGKCITNRASGNNRDISRENGRRDSVGMFAKDFRVK